MNKKMIVGLVIISVLVLIGLFAPYIATIDPELNNLSSRLAPPSKEFLLGTDHLGRDVFSRLLHGTKLSMGIAFVVLIISLSIGLVFGLISGYFGGIVDKVVMTIVEIFLAFPSMVLALAVVGIMGPGIKNAVIAVCIVSWIGYTRIVRGMVLSIKEKEFVKSAVLNGSSDFKIIARHILPNVINTVIIYSATNISNIMMQIAALSFLGMGVQPPIAEWGNMLNEAKGYITAAPWLIIAPSVAIITMIVGVNLFGEGLTKFLSEDKTGGT